MSFKTSEGERVTKTFIDGQIRKTKKQFVDDAREEGREYCWACGTTNDRLTCSHIISVNDCQNDSRTEIAYLYDNLQLECISNGCHMETETGNISHHANARYKKEFIERYNNGEI